MLVLIPLLLLVLAIVYYCHKSKDPDLDVFAFGPAFNRNSDDLDEILSVSLEGLNSAVPIP
ncbi:MAG: hypothetical protein MHM6MM_001545 [Cercozoa sp. M6MM]